MSLPPFQDGVPLTAAQLNALLTGQALPTSAFAVGSAADGSPVPRTAGDFADALAGLAGTQLQALADALAPLLPAGTGGDTTQPANVALTASGQPILLAQGGYLQF